MALSVGIDLGTTFSAVAYVNRLTNRPEIIVNEEGNKITPSIIYFQDDEVIFDSEAEEAFKEGISTCAAAFKRSMGDPNPCFYYAGKGYRSVDLSAMLLKHLKESAEAEMGEAIQNVVITVPAYFYSREREDTKLAAEMAGLKVKKIIDEPNAAVLAYGIEHWRENAYILVYDLGGGTFDVTLTHMDKNGELVALVTRGDKNLGGKDWDERLKELLVEKFYNETDMTPDEDDLLEIRGMSESVKKKLSKLDSVNVKASITGYGYAEVTVSRQEFEAVTADLIDRTCDLCNEVLKEAGIKWQNVTDILLVGGSTRMPQVSIRLTKLSGKKPIAHVNPDEAVALGAAIQATKKSASTYVCLSVVEDGGKKKTNMQNSGLGQYVTVKPKQVIKDLGYISLRETTAHAMGVVAKNDEEDYYYNEVIIPPNHPRPVRAAKRFRFFTSPDKANELEIYVLQGEDPNPINCIFTHKYVVSGIRHVKRGDKYGTVIRIQYSYDDNGIIRIQARQENDNVDLPIRKEELPSDISRFGCPPSAENAALDGFMGVQIGGGSTKDIVHKYKSITFSNVEWEKYDNISYHPSGEQYNEPQIHIVANEKKIEFHGYNVSQMDEGVRYSINPADDFEIKCDIDTTFIQPHPGGELIISLGIISARINQYGGEFYMQGEKVASVGPQFSLKMSLNNGGIYTILVNGKEVGCREHKENDMVDIVFGFRHDSHCCSILSHAFVNDIEMLQGMNSSGDADNSDTETWED